MEIGDLCYMNISIYIFIYSTSDITFVARALNYVK